MTARFNRAAAATACTLVTAGSAWTAAAAEAPSAAELERYAPNLVRLSRISVDPAQLEQYKAILAEEARASMAAERILYAVSEKKDPTKFTILEIYASQEAYQSHLKTPHFLKYKNGTLDMVKSLELIDCDPLVPEALMKP